MSVTVQKIDCRHQYLANGKIWFHAMHRGSVVGSLSVTTDNGFAWLNDLFVEEESRRCGIARRLLESAINVLRPRPLKGACAGINEENVPSIRLFESAGFRHVFTFPNEPTRLYSIAFPEAAKESC